MNTTVKPLNVYVELIDKGDVDTLGYRLPPSDSKVVLPTFPNNYTILHYAAKLGKSRIVMHLLENGYYNINTCLDDFGNNALMEACRGDHHQNVDCVAQLANLQEIDLLHKNRNRMNVLEVTCAESKCRQHFYKDKKSCTYERMTSILLKAGGLPLLESCCGMHLYFAIRNEHRSIVRMFLKAKELFFPNDEFQTILYDEAPHGALRNCLTQEMTRIILEEGDANVHARDFRFRTALHTAASFGRAEVCKYLLEKGADPNAHDDLGKTPLFLCCESMSNVYPDANWLDTISVLVESGTIINQRDLQYKITALEYLSKYKSNFDEGAKAIQMMKSTTIERDNIKHNLFKNLP